MMAHLKTNPAYAHLAYRRTILVALVETLRGDYLALSSDEPKKELVCEEVFKEDAIVPPEDIQALIEELERESERVRLELAKFTFGIHNEREGHGLFGTQTPTPSNEESKGQEGPHKRRRRRR